MSKHTLFLIGFNSSLFDDPYTINRLYKLVGDNAEHIITDFELKKFGRVFNIDNCFLIIGRNKIDGENFQKLFKKSNNFYLIIT